MPALLRALVTLDGEAIVFHPGDNPYLVSPRGPVELSSRPLTTNALTALLAELLPLETLAALEASDRFNGNGRPPRICPPTDLSSSPRVSTTNPGSK